MDDKFNKISQLIDNLRKDAEMIFDLAEKASRKYSPDPNAHINLVHKYQAWYRLGHELVRTNLPSGLAEFEELYSRKEFTLYPGQCSNIKTFLDEPDPATYDDFKKYFTTQMGILFSLPEVLEARKLELESAITEKLLLELLTATEEILAKDSTQAAGIIIGSALKQYLGASCKKEGLSVDRGESINSLAQKLREVDVLSERSIRRIKAIEEAYVDCLGGKKPDKAEIEELLEEAKSVVRGL